MTNARLVCPLHRDCRVSTGRQEGLVFVAYPFRRRQLRTTLSRVGRRLRRRKDPLRLRFYYADEDIMTGALLCKICQKIQSSQLCLFDIRGRNFNVGLEYGLALGKGIEGVLLLSKGERRLIPSDLAGLDSLEFTSYADLEKRLVRQLPVLLGTGASPIPASTALTSRPVSAAARSEGFATTFEGDEFDRDKWRVELGDVPMIRQSNGLWVEWGNLERHALSGNLTLRESLPAEFEAEATLIGDTFGIGWDPGIYLYAGNGTDMLLGVNLMPPVPAWGIAQPVAVVRTPRVPCETGRLAFDTHRQVRVSPGVAVRVVVRVHSNVADFALADTAPVQLPLHAKPKELVVGAYRWAQTPGARIGYEARSCIATFSYRPL